MKDQRLSRTNYIRFISTDCDVPEEVSGTIDPEVDWTIKMPLVDLATSSFILLAVIMLEKI